MGLRPSSLSPFSSPRGSLRAGGRSKEVAFGALPNGEAEGAPAIQEGAEEEAMARSKTMQVQFVARENGPERLVTEAEIIFDDGPLNAIIQASGLRHEGKPPFGASASDFGS